MSEEVLFQITQEQLETGLRGYPCGYCTTSKVDPLKGLHYGDIAVSQLIDKSPEEVIYLLVQGKMGSHDEVDIFFKDIKKHAALSEKTIDSLLKLPREGHPMKLFSAALLILGIFEGIGDYKKDCMRLIAKLPQLVAVLINHHAGWGATPAPRADLGYMENFTHMLQVPNADRAALLEALKLFNILHYDHGGGNLSTFVGKAVASGLEDMYGSMCSAMCALGGPRHGRANQDCLEFVYSMLKEVGEDATEAQVESAIRQRLEKGQLLFGFGHAVLRAEDSRATVQYDYISKKYKELPLVKIALLLRQAGTKVLKENPKIASPYPNVDAISGTLLTAAGFPYPEYYTVLFGLSRCIGIAVQIVYERTEARGGKGTPIVRPKYLFKKR